MSFTVAATDITLHILKQQFGLKASQDPNFFPEWSTAPEALEESEKQLLQRVKTNYLALMEDPPLLENSVKMVVLAPLLDLAGFYRPPFRIQTEASVNLEMVDEGATIRGRIDVLVITERLWVVVIESKRSDFAVTRAIPQTLAHLLSNPDQEKDAFGLISNGSEFLFLKASHHPSPEYAPSRLFSLINPGNDLEKVLIILKYLGTLSKTH